MKREYTKSVAHTVKTSGVMIIWNICRLELKKLKHTAPQELQKQNTSNILAHKDIFSNVSSLTSVVKAPIMT